MIESVRTERKTQRRRTIAALLASLVIHLLIVLAAFVILSIKPAWTPRKQPAASPEPPEFTLLPPPPPAKREGREFFDAAQGQVSEKAPEDATFESDQNTAAASEQPAQSDAPIPTQAGDDAPGLTLRSQDLSLGPVREPSPPAPAAREQRPRPPAREEAREPESVAPPKEAAPEQPAKKPTPAPTATPTPKPTPKPEDDALALLDPSRPAPKPPSPEATPEARRPRPEKPSPPSAPRAPGFQPQTRVTRLTGGISNRGKSSVAAVATPLGRYKKMLSDAIGSRWYYYVNDMLDLVGIGTVELRFIVRADGSVERVQVLRNTSNEGLASCSVRAIMEAEIPPIPKDIAPTLEGERLEVDYSFTILGR